jgi:alkylated DNA repair dioxygenase AlkB
LAAELAAACPVVQLVRGVLPPGLADALLLELVAAAPRWPQSEWWVQGARHIAARRTVVYPLPAQAELPRGNGERPEPEYKQSAADPPPSLAAAAAVVEAAVAAHSRAGSGAWRPTYALANSYLDGGEKVGLHSDGLTSLGPRPLVAGLSLGAARPFACGAGWSGPGRRRRRWR